MLISMNLLKQNNKEILYNFGSQINAMDGVIHIDLEDLNKSEIEQMPSDNSVTRNCAYKALGKLLRVVLNGEVPEKIEYVN